MIRTRSIAVVFTRGLVRSANASAWRGAKGDGTAVTAVGVRACSNRPGELPPSTALPPLEVPTFADSAVANEVERVDCVGQHEAGDAQDLSNQSQAPFSSLVERAAPAQQERTPESLFLRKIFQVAGSRQANKLEAALSLLEEGRASGFKSKQAYLAVIQMMAFHRVPDKLEGLVRQMVEDDGLEQDLDVYNSIINVYSQTHQPDLAVQTFREMEEKGVTPNWLTYSNMITAYGKRHPEEMYKMLRVLDENKWPATRGAYLCLVGAMWRRKDMEGVLNILGQMRKEEKHPTEAALAMGLMAAAHLGRVDAAEVLFEERLKFGYPLKEEVYVSMILACYKSSRCADALSYWRQLLVQDGIGQVRIRPQTYQLPFKAAVAGSEWDEMEAILDIMQATLPGKWSQELLDSVSKFPAQGALPAEQTFNSVIGNPKIIRNQMHVQRVDYAFSALERRGLVPTRAQVLEMAMVFSNNKMSEKAASFFGRVRTDGERMSLNAWGHWLRSLRNLGRHEEVVKVWKAAKEEGVERLADCRMLQTMIRTANDLEDPDMVQELLDQGVEEGTVGRNVYNTAVRALVEMRQLDRALDVHKGTKRSSSKDGDASQGAVTYDVQYSSEILNRLMRGCMLENRTETALEILGEMRSSPRPARMDYHNVWFIIEALVKHDRASEVVPLFDKIIAEGTRPSRSCFAQVAEVAFNLGDEVNAWRYFTKARARRQTLSPELMAFAREKNWIKNSSMGTRNSESNESETRDGAPDDLVEGEEPLAEETSGRVVAQST